MKVYIAGPMSGIPKFNIPAFDTAALLLREEGHVVVSPAELDGPETRETLLASATGAHADLPSGETWGFYLARDIRLIVDDGIEAVAVLDGWHKSRGAKLETFVAAAIRELPVYRYTSLLYPDPKPFPMAMLSSVWTGIPSPLREKERHV